MYEYIHGQLIEITPSFAILDVNGVGYRLHTPISYLDALPQKEGAKVLLYTTWIVRETAQTLYGFLTKTERELFELLITLSGIGPKTALLLIGHLPLPDLEEAVRTNNLLAFAKIPGIGKKTAERLIVELRDRLAHFALPNQPIPSKRRDALNALIHLGYTVASAEKAIKQVTATLPEEADLSLLISAALKL